MKIITIIVFTLWLTSQLMSQNNTTMDSIEGLIQIGEINKAREIVKDSYTKDDEDPQTNYWLAILALRDTLYDDALDYLDVAIEGDESNAEYYYMLGQAYGMKAQNVGAITAAFTAPKVKSSWIKALELDPKHIKAKWGLFQYYINAPGILGGDNDEAKKLAYALVKDDPQRGYNMLAYFYAVVGENLVEADKAIAKSMTYISDEKTNQIVLNRYTNILNRIGYQFLEQEDYDKSRKYFKGAIRFRPDFENSYDSMGDYFSAVSQFDSALVYYEKAIMIKPDLVVSRYNKGLMLEKLDKKDEAVKEFHEIIQNYPESNYADQAAERLEELNK
jgi:tetratricopeptide (TPR) repeat protein